MIMRALSRLFPNKYGWFGRYSSWDDAVRATEGYNSTEIFEKVKNAALKVKSGEAAFERDSVAFNEPEYSWALLSALLWIAGQKEGHLRLIDFGGSLGSTYYQHRKFLNGLQDVSWNIIEQETFCRIGKEMFQDDRLYFYLDIKSCLAEHKVDAVLLGCVLPYVPNPFQLLDEIFAHNFPFLIIDRMPFIDEASDRLTIQKVPPAIYTASYPAWFFSYEKFMRTVSARYDVVAEYMCNDEANIPSVYKGLILKLKA